MAKILIEEAALDSLKRMVEELERDAARYRWVRDFCSGTAKDGDLYPEIALYGLCGNADKAFCKNSKNGLDAAIDAAMKQ